MKTYNTIYKFMKAMSLIAMTLVLANCGKSDNGGGNGTSTAYTMSNGSCMQNNVATPLSNCQSISGTYYGWQNNLCYQVGNNTYTNVATTYCSGIPSYTYSGTQCYQTINGQQTAVSSTYCTTVTTGVAAVCNTSTGNYNNAQTQSCSGLYYGSNAQVFCSPTMSCGQTSQVSNGWQSVTQMNCSGLTLQSQYGQVVYCQ